MAIGAGANRMAGFGIRLSIKIGDPIRSAIGSSPMTMAGPGFPKILGGRCRFTMDAGSTILGAGAGPGCQAPNGDRHGSAGAAGAVSSAGHPYRPIFDSIRGLGLPLQGRTLGAVGIPGPSSLRSGSFIAA